MIVALDQFPRSVWRDAPGAYAQDIKACRLVLDALDNARHAALPNVSEKTFRLIANGRREGPDHLERLERGLTLALLVQEAPERLLISHRLSEDQNRMARDVIARFKRHPHRNGVLGRISTPAEEAYIAAGRFPHVRDIPQTPEGLEALLARRDGVA